MNNSPIIKSIECLTCNSSSNVTKVGWIITHNTDWKSIIIVIVIFVVSLMIIILLRIRCTKGDLN